MGDGFKLYIGKEYLQNVLPNVSHLSIKPSVKIEHRLSAGCNYPVSETSKKAWSKCSLNLAKNPEVYVNFSGQLSE